MPTRKLRAVEWLLKHNNRFAHCYNCTVCRKAFNCSWLLIVHFRIHMRPFKCGFCGKGFSRVWILKSNIRRHTWKALSMPNMWRTICWALKFETAFFFVCNALMICPVTILITDIYPLSFLTTLLTKMASHSLNSSKEQFQASRIMFQDQYIADESSVAHTLASAFH